jgi:hypothetical protein
MMYLLVELQMETMYHAPWTSACWFYNKMVWIPFIYMDGRPDVFDARLYVGNHYLSTLLYLLVDLQLGDYAPCPMDECLLVSK